MDDSLEQLKKIYTSQSDQALSDFFTFLSFPSISSEEAYTEQCEQCALWLKDYVEKIGFETKLWPTPGKPVIFAENNQAGPNAPTLLIYNHYDVQPVDPLNEWISPPFEPTIREGQVYARGAQDNKGQCLYVLQALKILKEKMGHFPLNIKLCIEGEEECGSHGLAEILKLHLRELKADYLAVVDFDIKGPEKPTLTLGFRGIITLDVEMTGSHFDLHSGQHGGIVYNPIHALIETLAKLRDEQGKILVPGFYDDVQKLSPQDILQLSLDFNQEEYERQFRAKPVGGEKELNPFERNWLRPTLEINGITGGYSGPGFKTVIPAKASAKISCRLVSNQTPEKIGKLVSDFIYHNAPEGVNVVIKRHPGGGKAVSSPPSSKVTKAFAQALEEIFGKPCEFIYAGGSIPVISELALASQAELVLLGVGLSTDGIHSPNERFGIDRLEKGALMMARAIELLSMPEHIQKLD